MRYGQNISNIYNDNMEQPPIGVGSQPQSNQQPFFENGKYKIDKNPTVTPEFDLALSELENYFKEKDIQYGSFLKQFKEYQESNLNYVKEPFSRLLQLLSDKKILKDNKKLYSEIAIFLDYASENDLLHKTRKQNYENFLKRALFEDNKDSVDSSDIYSLEMLDYLQYVNNNFRKSYKNQAINSIYEKGGAIFLNSDGKICCKFSKDSELKIYSKRQAEMMLSKVLRFPIKITEKVPKYTDIDPDTIFTSEAIVMDNDDG